MDQKKLPEDPITSFEKEVGLPMSDAPDQQLTELKELTRSLLQTVQVMHAQNTRNSKFDDTLTDLKMAARAVLTPSVTAVNPHQAGVKDCCGDGPCGCIGKDCCCFEIVLSQVRAAAPQKEPADSGDIVGLTNALEVQIYVTNDNIGFLWPGLATTMDLRANGLPSVGPGPWVVIERVINRVYVKKGVQVNKKIKVGTLEVDAGIERPIGMKDEFGEGSGEITLDCCMPIIYPPMPIEIPLSFGGEGGGTIQVAFYARRVCC